MFIEFKQKLESDVKKNLIDVSFISKDKLKVLFETNKLEEYETFYLEFY
jgi:hypothetical protein